MRHRASRLHAVVAALLLAFGVLGTTAGVASLTSSASDLSAAATTRTHDHLAARHEASAPRLTALTGTASAHHATGPHVDLVAVLATVAAGALLALGWLVVGRRTDRLARLVVSRLGARAPPALV